MTVELQDAMTRLQKIINDEPTLQNELGKIKEALLFVDPSRFVAAYLSFIKGYSRHLLAGKGFLPVDEMRTIVNSVPYGDNAEIIFILQLSR